ncbi:MAG: hypothetical protein AAGE89_18185 [Pseudomonadota bacterium]
MYDAVIPTKVRYAHKVGFSAISPTMNRNLWTLPQEHPVLLGGPIEPAALETAYYAAIKTGNMQILSCRPFPVSGNLFAASLSKWCVKAARSLKARKHDGLKEISQMRERAPQSAAAS